MDLSGEVDMAVTTKNWEQLLVGFTNRNASRLTSMEVDAADLGAQQEESAFPLRGVAYDRRADEVEIMLGDLSSTAHLTHTIHRPSAIDLLTDEAGRDRMLRIATDDGGQTLLRLID